MTSKGDIVERLRQNPSSDLAQEAAIERLRAALVIARENARTEADTGSNCIGLKKPSRTCANCCSSKP
jgi:hypothetical protein